MSFDIPESVMSDQDLIVKLVKDLYELKSEFDGLDERYKYLKGDTQEAEEIFSPIFKDHYGETSISTIAKIVFQSWKKFKENFSEAEKQWVINQKEVEKIKEQAWAVMGPVALCEEKTHGLFDLFDSMAHQLRHYKEKANKLEEETRDSSRRASSEGFYHAIPGRILSNIRDEEANLASLEEAERQDPTEVGLAESLTDSRSRLQTLYRRMFSYYTCGRDLNEEGV